MPGQTSHGLVRVAVEQLVLSAVERLAQEGLIHEENTPSILGWKRDAEGLLYPRMPKLRGVSQGFQFSGSRRYRNFLR
jgi:hypothetical protein